jgi:hypothetical protein
LNVRDGPRERQSVPVVGPLREIDGQDLFKLWIGTASVRTSHMQGRNKQRAMSVPLALYSESHQGTVAAQG